MELPIKSLPHVIEKIDDWPIHQLYDHRPKLIEEINKSAINSLKTKYVGKLDKVLARTIYMEKIRMKEEPWSADPQNEPLFWKKSKNRSLTTMLMYMKSRVVVNIC